MTVSSSARLDPISWTLADLLSSLRYWAFVLAVVLAACVARSFSSLMPMLASQMGSTASEIGVLSMGMVAGWSIGGVLALLVMPRHPRMALALPLIVLAALFMGAATSSAFWLFSPIVVLQGVCIGAFTMMSVVAVAGVLAGCGMSRSDFIQALALPILMVGTIPDGVMMLSAALAAERQFQDFAMIWTLVLIVAIALLSSARGLAFDELPRRRHSPLACRDRSPLRVAVIALLPALCALVLMATSSRTGLTAQWNDTMLAVVRTGAWTLSIASLVYALYWIFRIHGEVASLKPSAGLFTPRAAVCLTLFVPLGFLLVLNTLGGVLRAHAHGAGQRPGPHGRWLAFWSVVMAPVAMAMLQGAVNRQRR